jgi:hypothetical protein
MQNEREDIRHKSIRKKVILGGVVILAAITVISSVSSFMIYREGFRDLPYLIQQALGLFAVIIVEGAFVWLIFGFTRAFTSLMERLICILGMTFTVATMLINIVTHFMMVKNIPLQPFQHGWISWGAISVFVAILLIVLMITLADPVTRILRLELRYMGKRDETIIQAKTESLESDKIRAALEERAEYEAQRLAEKIINEGRQLPPAGGATHRPGFQPSTAKNTRTERAEHEDPNG